MEGCSLQTKLQVVIFRLLAGLLGLGLLATLAMVSVIAYDGIFTSQRVAKLANVTYPAQDDTTLYAYLARPQGDGPFPAVLLVHEAFGLDAEAVKKADLLSRQGYLVLAVDAYRGKAASLMPRAFWLRLSIPEEQIRSDIDDGYDYLSQLEQVNSHRIGALGFSFGGEQVMYLATRNPDLAATVIFYGNNPIANPAELGLMSQGGPVLGIYAAHDASISLDRVLAFDKAMQIAGVIHQITVYPGVGGAFVNSQAIAAAGPAQEAWNQMLGFLAQQLKT